MKYKIKKNMKFCRKKMPIVVLLITIIVLTACSGNPAPAPTMDPGLIQTYSAQTVIAQITSAAPPLATEAPPPGPTPDPDIPVSIVPEPEPGEPSVTANYNTAIFSGPGTNYVIYGAFLGGKQAVPVGRSEDGLWWAIDVPVAATKVGWVSTAWVTAVRAEHLPVLSTPPVPPSTVLVPPGADDPQAISLANTFVRTGPGNIYPAYGIANAGAKAWVIGKSEDGQWLVVRLDPLVVGAGYGWAALQYVHTRNTENIQVIKASAPPVVEPLPPPRPEEPSATAQDYVNVRTGPGIHYSTLFAASPGSSGMVTGRSADNEWWQVQIPTDFIDSGLGWVSQFYVSSANTEAVPVVTAPPLPTSSEDSLTSGTCDLITQNPVNETVLEAGSLFQTSWTVKNTSQELWDKASIEIRYLSSDGTPLHLGSDLYVLEQNVGMDQNYTFTVPMIAPSQPGKYSELWVIAGETESVTCRFWLTIEVQ